MLTWLARLLGHKMVHRQVAEHTHSGGILDLNFGLKLLRDRRVSATAKIAALGLGMLLVGVLIACEVPLEVFLAMVLPVLGFIPDALIDGMELLLGPLMFASLLIPHLAPRELVAALRDEHRGLKPAPATAGIPRR